MISSQLQSQLFSKEITWTIILEKYDDFYRRTAPPELVVEVWQKCVRVYLPKTEHRRGVSIFLSFWDYLDCFMMRSHYKSRKIQAFQIKSNLFQVTSSQGTEAEPHTVSLNIWGNASCSCMLFKCLRNRIKNEVPYYWELMQKSRFFAGQVVCHHIDAVVERLHFGTLADYLEHRRSNKT